MPGAQVIGRAQAGRAEVILDLGQPIVRGLAFFDGLGQRVLERGQDVLVGTSLPRARAKQLGHAVAAECGRFTPRVW